MPSGLHPRLANAIVDTAIWRLNSTPGKNIVCAKNQLREAILAAIEEACEIGFLQGQKERNCESTCPGSLERPAWMDIQLNDKESLKSHGVRFKPVSLKSLLNAGFCCLGDLRWVPARELRELHYIGLKTSRQIREIVERLERSPLA
jgi:hypothetical protein